MLGVDIKYLQITLIFSGGGNNFENLIFMGMSFELANHYCYQGGVGITNDEGEVHLGCRLGLFVVDLPLTSSEMV